MKGEFNFEVRDMHLLRWEGSAQQADLLYGLFVPPDRLTCFGPLRVRLSGWLKSLWGLGIPAGYGVFSRCNAAANPQLRPVLRAGSITTPDLDIRHENDYGNFQYSRSAKGYRGQYRVF